MKKMIAVALTVILTYALCVSCATAEVGDRGEFYPLLTVVVGCVQDVDGLWAVDCMDKDGNVWSFWEDEEPWEEGDLCNLLMWNMGGREEDDEVVEVYYEGHLEALEAWITD